MSYCVDHRQGSVLTLLWLWCKPAAISPFRPHPGTLRMLQVWSQKIRPKNINFMFEMNCRCIFFCACWPFICLLWRKVYLGLLPILKFFFSSWLLSCLCCLYILEIKPYRCHCLQILSTTKQVDFSGFFFLCFSLLCKSL